MATDSAFETSQFIFLGEMKVEFVLDGRWVSAQAKAVEKLFPSPKVVFEVSGVPREPQCTEETHPGPPPISVRRAPVTSDGPEKLRLEYGVEVEVVPTSWIFIQQDATIHLARRPSVVFRSGDPIASLQFKILNFSNSVLQWPIVLGVAPWLVKIEPVTNLIGLERTLRSNSGYAVTHRASITGHLGRDFQANSSNIPTPSRTRYQGHFEPHIKATWSQLSQAISNHISPDTPTPRRPIPTAKPLLNPNKTGTQPRTSPTPRTGPPGRSPYHPLTTRQPRQSGTRTPPAPGPNPTGTQPNAGLIPGQKPASRTPGRNTAKQPEYPVAKRHPGVISLQRTM